MVELIMVKKGEILTNSMVIAEVFKKPHEAEVKRDSKVLQREQVSPTVLPRPDKKRSQDITDENKNTKQLGWIKDTQIKKEIQTDTKKPRKLFLNEVVIKQETLIFGALGAVFLSLQN